ncbi:crooked neck-like protein 1 [Tanacetum coccineum]
MKQGWCGQPYKDLLWRAASATNVRDFEKCMLELTTMNPKAHEWLNKIPAEYCVRSHFSGKAKSDLLLNNICEVFNGKIVRGRDKPVITLLEYIREYCMKGIVNVQGLIDKYTGPLTPTATRIMESVNKKAHLMKVQWNGANKYQVSGSLGDQCVVDVVSMTCSCRKWELTRIPSKHAIAACWNMALNDRATPPPETWVNPSYWLSTWKETYSYKIQPICRTKYREKSTCPTTLLRPKHHVQVGRPKKKRKRSKHKDEPFVKDGKLCMKGRTITCQSCRNTGHNKATCKGQGQKATTSGNNVEASDSASRQAQQTNPAVGQDVLGGSCAGTVIGLSATAGEGSAGDPGGASQGSSQTRWTERRVQTERISPQKRTPTQTASQPSTSSQTRNADGREMGDGVPTQSSATGGASEWSFLYFQKTNMFQESVCL